MFVVPKTGLKVYDPALSDHLPATGREVPAIAYWLRRISDGDVTRTDVPTPGDVEIAQNIVRGTTAERPRVGTPGMLRFNTDLNGLEFFGGGEWQVFTSGGTVDATARANAASALSQVGQAVMDAALALDVAAGAVQADQPAPYPVLLTPVPEVPITESGPVTHAHNGRILSCVGAGIVLTLTDNPAAGVALVVGDQITVKNDNALGGANVRLDLSGARVLDLGAEVGASILILPGRTFSMFRRRVALGANLWDVQIPALPASDAVPVTVTFAFTQQPTGGDQGTTMPVSAVASGSVPGVTFTVLQPDGSETTFSAAATLTNGVWSANLIRPAAANGYTVRATADGATGKLSNSFNTTIPATLTEAQPAGVGNGVPWIPQLSDFRTSSGNAGFVAAMLQQHATLNQPVIGVPATASTNGTLAAINISASGDGYAAATKAALMHTPVVGQPAVAVPEVAVSLVVVYGRIVDVTHTGTATGLVNPYVALSDAGGGTGAALIARLGSDNPGREVMHARFPAGSGPLGPLWYFDGIGSGAAGTGGGVSVAFDIGAEYANSDATDPAQVTGWIRVPVSPAINANGGAQVHRGRIATFPPAARGRWLRGTVSNFGGSSALIATQVGDGNHQSPLVPLGQLPIVVTIGDSDSTNNTVPVAMRAAAREANDGLQTGLWFVAVSKDGLRPNEFEAKALGALFAALPRIGAVFMTVCNPVEIAGPPYVFTGDFAEGATERGIVEALGRSMLARSALFVFSSGRAGNDDPVFHTDNFITLVNNGGFGRLMRGYVARDTLTSNWNGTYGDLMDEGAVVQWEDPANAYKSATDGHMSAAKYPTFRSYGKRLQLRRLLGLPLDGMAMLDRRIAEYTAAGGATLAQRGGLITAWQGREATTPAPSPGQRTARDDQLARIRAVPLAAGAVAAAALAAPVRTSAANLGPNPAAGTVLLTLSAPPAGARHGLRRMDGWWKMADDDLTVVATGVRDMPAGTYAVDGFTVDPAAPNSWLPWTASVVLAAAAQAALSGTVSAPANAAQGQAVSVAWTRSAAGPVFLALRRSNGMVGSPVSAGTGASGSGTLTPTGSGSYYVDAFASETASAPFASSGVFAVAASAAGGYPMTGWVGFGGPAPVEDTAFKSPSNENTLRFAEDTSGGEHGCYVDLFLPAGRRTLEAYFHPNAFPGMTFQLQGFDGATYKGRVGNRYRMDTGGTTNGLTSGTDFVLHSHSIVTLTNGWRKWVADCTVPWAKQRLVVSSNASAGVQNYAGSGTAVFHVGPGTIVAPA